MLQFIKHQSAYSFDKIFLLLISMSILLPGFGAIDNNAIKWLSLSILSIFYFIYILFFEKKELQIGFQKTGFILIAIVYFTLTAINSDNINEGLVTLYKLVIIGSILFSCLVAFKKIDNALIFLCKLFALSLIIECGYTVFDFFTSDNSFTGISNNRNISSSSIVFKLIFLIYLISHSSKGIFKVQLKILEVLTIVSVIILQSRLGLYSVFFIYTFYFFLNTKRKKEFFISILISVLILVFFNQSNFKNKIDKSFGVENLLEDDSSVQRLSFYEASISLFKQKPFFGHGLGSWKYKSLQYNRQNNKNILLPYYTHNDFLQILMETGIIGLFIYLLFFYSITFRLLTSLKNNKNYNFLIIMLVVVIFNSLINFPIHRSQEYIPFIMCCSFIYTTGNERKQINRRSSMLFLALLIPSSLIGFFEHKSLIIQDKLLNDYKNNRFTISIQEIEKINFKWPNLSSNVVPVSTYISRYYFNDKNYIKSLSLLNYSIGINKNDLMTNELLLRNYIFTNNKDKAYELVKNLLTRYPNNKNYKEILQAISRDLNIKD